MGGIQLELLRPIIWANRFWGIEVTQNYLMAAGETRAVKEDMGETWGNRDYSSSGVGIHIRCGQLAGHRERN